MNGESEVRDRREKSEVNEAPSLPRAEVSEGKWRDRPEVRGTGRNVR